jgi:periplasmic protein TonB
MATIAEIASELTDSAPVAIVDADEPREFTVPALTTDLPLIPAVVVSSKLASIASLTAAIALHVGTLAFINWPRSDRTLGIDGIELDAISIEMVTASSLESTAAAVAAGAGATTAALADRDGAETERTASVDMPDTRQKPQPEAAAKAADLVIPDIVLKPDVVEPDQATIVIAPAKGESAAAPDSPSDAPAKPQSTDAAALSSAPSEAQAAAVLGGATARSPSPVTIAAQSAAIARAGTMNAYGVTVYRAVAQNVRRVAPANRMVGTVRVEFGLGVDGAVGYARILASSGNPMLDQAALDTVRTAKFPSPPTGARIDELKYNIPLKFE